MVEMDLARLLENRNLGTRTKNIFIGYVPVTPKTLTVVRVYGGMPPEKKFGSSAVGYEFPRLQLLFRGEPESLEATMDRAWKAHDLCVAVEAEELESGDLYHRIQPLGPPQFLRYDDSKCPEVVLNVQVEKER